MKFRSPFQVPYKLVPSPAHLLALVPGRRKAIEVRIYVFIDLSGPHVFHLVRSGEELEHFKHFMSSMPPRHLQN